MVAATINIELRIKCISSTSTKLIIDIDAEEESLIDLKERWELL